MEQVVEISITCNLSGQRAIKVDVEGRLLVAPIGFQVG